MKINLTHNLGFKILSIVAAALLWLIVVNVDDPVKTVTYKNIHVDTINENAIFDKGKVFEVIENSDTVNIVVTAKRSLHRELTSEDFKATADMKELDLNFMDSVTIDVIPLKYATQISDEDIKVKPQNLKVSIEDSETKPFPVTVKTSGKAGDGYEWGEPRISPASVKITGPKSRVNKIGQVVANVDIAGLTSNESIPSKLTIYDKNGDVIDETSSKLEYNVSGGVVTIYANMLKTIQSNISITSKGSPADGYYLDKIVFEPKTIELAGTKEVLLNAATINIPDTELDITGATSDVEKVIEITSYIPAGTQLVNKEIKTISATAYIKEFKTKSIDLPIESIAVVNSPDNYNVQFPGGNVPVIMVRAKEGVIDSFDISQVQASIDLTGVKEDTESVEVEVQLPEEFELIGTVTAAVKVTKADKKADDAKDAPASNNSDSKKGSDKKNT